VIPRCHRLPIDFFFRSLAQDQRERAICIVLSGTGSDGTLGVRAVKGAEALRESVQNFSDLANNAYDGILIVTADGRHLYANQRAAESKKWCECWPKVKALKKLAKNSLSALRP
jgi:PAS domain-containing protein